MRFKFFSEEEWFVNGECPRCNRVMRIRRELTAAAGSGFRFLQPVACKCGNVFHGIDAPQTSAQPQAAVNKDRTSPSDGGSGTMFAVIAATFGVMLMLYFLLRPDSPPVATAEVAKEEMVETDAALESSVKEAFTCLKGDFVAGRFFPKKEDIVMRTEPKPNSTPIINERASAVFGKTEYRTVGKSYVLSNACELNGWIEAQIVEVDGRPVEWERGWIPKSLVSAEPSADYLAGLLWNIDEDVGIKPGDRKIFREGALRVLRDNPDCKSVYTGYRSSTAGKYFVTCNSVTDTSFNVHFTREDLDAERRLGPQVPYAESLTRDACVNGIRREVGLAGSIDIYEVLGYATSTFPNGNRITIQEFSVTWVGGKESKYRANCGMSPDGKLSISITPLD